MIGMYVLSVRSNFLTEKLFDKNSRKNKNITRKAAAPILVGHNVLLDYNIKLNEFRISLAAEIVCIVVLINVRRVVTSYVQ